MSNYSELKNRFSREQLALCEVIRRNRQESLKVDNIFISGGSISKVCLRINATLIIELTDIEAQTQADNYINAVLEDDFALENTFSILKDYDFGGDGADLSRIQIKSFEYLKD